MKDLSQGFIALYRQFTEWEWYDDANTMRLFIHCLLLANYKDKKWRGKLIKRGSFITSQPKLAYSLKLSIKQIRGSLAKLKTTGEVAVQTTPEYSIISIKNYDFYQGEGRQTDRQKTKKGQTEGRQRATTNNIYKDTNNIYNTHTLTKNVCVENSNNLSEQDLKILRKYAKENGARRIKPYVAEIIKNGGYIDILKEEKSRIEKLEAQKQQQAEIIPPEIEEKSSPEDEKRGLELLRNTVKKIRKGQK